MSKRNNQWIRFGVLVALLLALASAAAGVGGAQAQDGEERFVDLGVELFPVITGGNPSDTLMHLRVGNLGNQTAYDVVVEVRSIGDSVGSWVLQYS